MYNIYEVYYRDNLTLKTYKTFVRALTIEQARDVMESEVRGDYEIQAICFYSFM